MAAPRARNTELTLRVSRGEAGAVEELTPLLYDELRSLARSYLARQRADHTLQPTALVHEAFLRLTDAESIDPLGRAHFFSLAAKTMRHVLVDHARRHNAEKRRGGWDRITLQGIFADDGTGEGATVGLELLDLDEALLRLAELDARQAEIVQLRFFGGLTGDEVGEVLGLSRATVVRELKMARAWLLRELDRSADREGSGAS